MTTNYSSPRSLRQIHPIVQQQQETFVLSISVQSIFYSSLPLLFVYSHRLVHPLSPRGKLVYRGLEGLQATNELIDAAVTAASSSSLVSASDIILRDCVWRCAQTIDHVKQLKKTAQDLPNLCEWIDGDEPSAPWSSFEATGGGEKTTPVLGGLRMFQGCRVVHVPSYLHGLWIACQQEALALNDDQEETEDGRSKVTVEWTHLGPEIRYREFNKEIESYDNVVLAAGAGIFQEYLKPNNEETSEGRETQQHQNHIFPVHLVRGQSIEFSSSLDGNNSAASIDDAFLCGKYISPLPRGEGSDGARRRVLVGATHEFKSDPMSREQVEEDMKCATQFMAPQLWEGNHFTKDRITEGYRVQSQRGPNGRLPLLGKLNSHLVPQDSDHTQLQHKNMWIFTGLSSRGLLYHALLADLLVSAVWADDEAGLMDQYPELGWWKK